MSRFKSSGGCRKCGGYTAARNLLCARCTTRGSGVKTFLLTMLAVQGIGIAAISLWNGSKADPEKTTMAHVVDYTAPSAGETEAHEIHQGWFYYAIHDDRLGDTTRHARLTSAVDDSESGPVKSAPDGALELRSSAVYGQSAVLTISRKPTDTAADQATLAVSFDNQPPRQFPAEESADNQAIIVAVADTKSFTTAMQGAHAMVVDAQLGSHTERRLRFQISGLNW